MHVQALPAERGVRTLMRMCGRALLRRCPRCGSGDVWKNWFNFRDRCPRCALELDRGESDHFYGAYALNFVVAELVPVVFFVVTLIATWPTPPWTVLTYVTGALAIISPFVLYPFTKTGWLALDLYFRPERGSEPA